MTTVAVRGLTLAVDSQVTCSGVKTGSTIKWCKMPKRLGGGYMAGTGEFADVVRFLSVFGECDPLKGVEAIHIKDGGELVIYEKGMPISAPTGIEFQAIGSGWELALGAMEMGASAESAVKVASKYCIYTAGEVHVLTVEPNPVDLT